MIKLLLFIIIGYILPVIIVIAFLKYVTKKWVTKEDVFMAFIPIVNFMLAIFLAGSYVYDKFWKIIIMERLWNWLNIGRNEGD